MTRFFLVAVAIAGASFTCCAMLADPPTGHIKLGAYANPR